MRWLAGLFLLLLPGAAAAQLVYPYDIPTAGASDQVICPNASYTGCATGLEENFTAVKSYVDAIDSDGDGVAEQAAALENNPAACDFAGAGEVVTDIAADGTLTCNTPAGGGDMSKATYDTDADNVVDSAEGLTCTGCVNSSHIADNTVDLELESADPFVTSIVATDFYALTTTSGRGRQLGTAAIGANEFFLRDDADASFNTVKVPIMRALGSSNCDTYDDNSACIRLPVDADFVSMHCYCDGCTAPSLASVNVEKRVASRAVAGTDICSAGDVTTTSAGAACAGMIADIDAGDWLCFSKQGGSPCGSPAFGGAVACDIYMTMRSP